MNADMNVALVVLDTARDDAITPDTAPNISALSKSGIRFENAYTCAPWTLPSHASLFTGTYSSFHRSGAKYKRLDNGLSTMAEVFSDSGYETRGYSNNVWISRSFGFDKGFSEFHHGWQYFQSERDLAEEAIQNEGLEKLKKVATGVVRGNPIKNVANLIYGIRHKYYSSNDDGAKSTTSEICSWLSDRDETDPFFLFVNYLEPHLEYDPPKEYVEEFLPEGVSYDRAMEVPQNAWEYITDQTDISDWEFGILRSLYEAEVNYVDGQVGALIQHMKDEGIWDDTIFIIIGDHGENIGHHDLMDHQYCLYDSLLHVPLIVNGGDITEADPSKLVQIHDLLPTLIDELDLDASNAQTQIQSTSFHPERSHERDQVYAEYLAPQPSRSAIEERVGDPHGVMDNFDRSLRAIRTTDRKLIVGSDGSTEAFNVHEDPAEIDDISAQHDFSDLETELSEWRSSVSGEEKSNDEEMDSSIENRLEDLGYLQ